MDPIKLFEGIQAIEAAKIAQMKASEPITNPKQIVAASDVEDKRIGPKPQAKLLPPPSHADPFHGIKCGAAGKRGKCGRQAQGHVASVSLREPIDSPISGSVAERTARLEGVLTAAAYGAAVDSSTVIELTGYGVPVERATGAYVSPRATGGIVEQSKPVPVCLTHLQLGSVEALHPDDVPQGRRVAPEPVAAPVASPEPVWTLDDLDPWRMKVTNYDPWFVFVTDGVRSVRCTPAEYRAKTGKHPGA